MLVATNAATIDYAPISNGTGEEFWGPGASILGQSFGQIFTAPETVLNTYSLILSQKSNDPFPFVSQIYKYDTTVVGAALYTSAVALTAPVLTTYTFTPNVNLVAGEQYIAVITNEPNGVSLGVPGGLGFALGTDAVSSGFAYGEGDPSIGADWLCQGGGCQGTPLALGLLGWRRKRYRSPI
jgi:hypothetical protein